MSAWGWVFKYTLHDGWLLQALSNMCSLLGVPAVGMQMQTTPRSGPENRVAG